jgi:preprotein translocase SecE subunit
VANKMADKKKSAGQSAARSRNRNRTADVKPRSDEKESDKNVEAVTSDKNVKVVAGDKEERKTQEKKPESKTVRRDSKGSSAAKGPSKWQIRLRSNRYVRFILDAYYELRHKVTWPTFHEARNMTIVVLVLSAAVGIFLGVVDYGLQSLYLLLVHLGGK